MKGRFARPRAGSRGTIVGPWQSGGAKILRAGRNCSGLAPPANLQGRFATPSQAEGPTTAKRQLQRRGSSCARQWRRATLRQRTRNVQSPGALPEREGGGRAPLRGTLALRRMLPMPPVSWILISGRLH